MRFASWGHWGISFWTGERGSNDARCIAEIAFAVGACGPVDGTLGSPERLRYQAICLAWTRDGELPEGAFCGASAAWLYDETFPGARWGAGGWESPVRTAAGWVWPSDASEAAA